MFKGKRKKILSIALGMAVMFTAGCGSGTESYDTEWGWTGGTEASTGEKTLVWTASAFGLYLDEDIIAELNRSLREDYGCDFQVRFELLMADGADYRELIEERRQQGEQTDILYTGMSLVGDKAAYDYMADNGFLCQLDQLLEQTQAGQDLYNTFSEAYWQTMVRGDGIYGLRCADNPQLSSDAVLLANQRYISDSQLPQDMDFWQIGDFLEEWNQEYDNSGLMSVLVDPKALCYLMGYMPLNSGYMGFYFEEEDGDIRIVSAAHEKKFLEIWKEIRRCNSMGRERAFVDDQAYAKGNFLFLIIGADPRILWDDVYAWTEGAAGVPVKVLQSVPQNASYPQNAVTGIASWSDYQEEAMQLLSLIATEPALSNLITYGVEGVNYELQDGRPVQIPGQPRGAGTGSVVSTANRMITYPSGLEPDNKTEIYTQRNEITQLSPAIIYELDEDEYLQEMYQLWTIYNRYSGLWYGEYEDVEGQVASLRRELEAAGVEDFLKRVNKLLK